MKCRPCDATMRFIYDPSGRVIVGHECQGCGATAWTWDAGVTHPPAPGERRYEPFVPILTDAPAPTVARAVTPPPPFVSTRGKHEAQACALPSCGVSFIPVGRQEYHTTACRETAKLARRGPTATRLGLHDEPEFSASNQ